MSIGILGTKLNILLIFTAHGSSESGLFYVPYLIFYGLMMFISSISQIIHPVLSGLKDPRKDIDALRTTLKLGFLTTIPLSSIVFFHAEEILSIFNPELIPANEILLILIVSFPLMVFGDLVYYLFYARGKYDYIFYIGLAANIPRVLFYFLLIPDFGNIGAAWAFTIGSIFQITITLLLLRKSNISLSYHHYISITLIPYAIGFLSSQMNIELWSVLIIFIVSYVLFLKLKLFNENDIQIYLQLFSYNKNLVENNHKIIKILKYCKLL